MSEHLPLQGAANGGYPIFTSADRPTALVVTVKEAVSGKDVATIFVCDGDTISVTGDASHAR